MKRTKQQTLRGISVSLTQAGRRHVGHLGEEWARIRLGDSGYDVVTTRCGDKRGDLVAIDRTTGEKRIVEVKTARRGKDGKWRFTLAKTGHTDHRNSDVVMALAVMTSGRVVPYVIPTDVLRDKRTVAITSHPDRYAGRYAPFKQSTALSLEVMPCPA